MITAIRNLITSKLGAAIALIFLGVVGLAFALSDATGIKNGGGSLGSENLARVGGRSISVVDFRLRVRRAYQRAQQDQPTLTMQQFVAQGGIDKLLKETTDIYALEQYGRAHGVGIDKLAIDAQIARNPAFAGLTGSFDQTVYEAALRREGISDRQLRGDMETESIVRQLVAPIGGLQSIPQGVALPYASLLLEQRAGQAVFIPAARFEPTAAPTDAQLTAFYTSQRARFTIPERRAIRFAILDESAVRTPPAVTAAEVQADYTANAATYAASETRQISQVIAGSKAVADRIAAAARAGGSLASAAQAAGLSAGPVSATSEAQYATATSAAAARAAFAASQGTVVGPVQVPLGYIVLTVTGINHQPARSLAEATPEITRKLTEQKRQEAMVDMFNGIQNALNSGASVTEVAQDKGLRLVTTPALLPNGAAPDTPAYRPDPLMQPIIQAAFGAGDGDPAQMVTLQENKIFALVEVATVLHAAPPPLASVRERIIPEWRRFEGDKAARDRARQVLAGVNRGQPLAAAANAVGVSGATQPIGGRRINLTNSQQRVPPEVALLFAMPLGTAKTLELPGNVGWMVIHLDRVVPGDAAQQTQLVQAVQQQYRDAIGGEYVSTLVAAARAAFPVTTNQAALTTLRNQLLGVAAGGNANP